MRPSDYHRTVDSRAMRRFAVRFILVLFILAAAFQSISFYVDSLWFESLGFESVYWYRLRAQGIVFLTFAVASGLLLYFFFRLVTPAGDYSRRPFVEIAGEAIVIPPPESLKRLAKPIAIILGIFFGLSFSSDWSRYALFINRVPTSSPPDPIFGRQISFYMFSLPVLEGIVGWLLAIAVIVLVAAILMSVTDMTASFKGVSIALTFLLLAIAAEIYVGRYALLFEPNTLFTGVRYVDDKIVVPGLWFVIAALVLGAALAAANVRSGRVRNIGVALAIPALTYLVAGVLAPGYVTAFVVRPNELVRETPYIRNNMDFTRKAFGLEHIEEIPFEPRVTNTVFDPAQHSDTLENARLWDWHALQSTLRQIQEIRTYYDFPDIDVDRYNINGKPQAMMVAARELNLNNLPAGSRNW